MQTKSRAKQTKSLQERLAEFAADARQEAAALPDGPERERLLRAVNKAETAAEMEVWANPPMAPEQA
jgi:hypothetical protein